MNVPSSVISAIVKRRLFGSTRSHTDAKWPHARVPALPRVPDNAAAARAEGLLAALSHAAVARVARDSAARAAPRVARLRGCQLDVIIAELATARPRRRVADRCGTIYAYSQEL